ncbi:lysyl-tRNA synthetase [Lentinula aciculospora]|uniref:Probable aspartate--tRNA ligase, cytoplasmic n=1 Tax=Lentinula aciculospora TaxID=153920 RepID=A0A9W9DME4_9AGAR|nr:lysyl-tRNA synthetase [Lentinula aciculospora]
MLGKTINLRARVHTIRAVSSALVFIVLRQQMDTVQGVLHVDHNSSSSSSSTTTPTPHMVHWASHLQEESIVHIKAIVQRPIHQNQINSTSIHNHELRIIQIHLISRVAVPVPFSVYDADLSAGADDDDDDNNKKIITPFIPDRARLSSRIIHLRSASAQSIFRIQSTISMVVFSTPTTPSTLPFIEIHTPKLQGGASESGASVFKLKYFGRLAFLAQSPQLFKQMAVAADFGTGGVFEVGPVFRAENSNTKRHLTEYTGLDLEMAIRKDYHEVMLVVDSVLKAIFKSVYEKRRREVDVVKTQFPAADLIWLPKTPVIAFADGVQMLIDDGWLDDSGHIPRKDEDLSTRAEIRLGELVKDKFHTDYYILDLFPKSARPFYTMPAGTETQSKLNAMHPDSKLTHSFDIFVRGQEITTGGQRIHDYEMLINSMAENDISARGLEEYLDGFRWGAPPHGGAGIGLERLLMLILGLSDIRYASMYPRDPKSLLEPPKGLEGLPHPEADTLGSQVLDHKRLESKTPTKPLPPLPSLIANYGDAANTSWLDDRYLVWRDLVTGGAIGFVPSSSGFAIIVGDPLCDKSQQPALVGRFLAWPSSSSPSSTITITTTTTSPSATTLIHPKPLPPLKPIWLLASSHLETILGSRLGWSSFTCIAESRVELEGEVPAALEEKEVGKKVRKAESEGVEVEAWMGRDGFQGGRAEGSDARISEWQDSRRKKGGQVRLTEVEVWRDYVHREYFTKDAEKSKMIPVALVVLHQLSPMYGFQVKYALDFPSTERFSAIEAALSSAMRAVASTGSGRITFGTSATSRLTPVRGVKGMKVKVLSHAYEAISDRMSLRGKGEFRKKMGAEEEDVYICYPRGGMGGRGAKAVLDFCVAES